MGCNFLWSVSWRGNQLTQGLHPVPRLLEERCLHKWRAAAMLPTVPSWSSFIPQWQTHLTKPAGPVPGGVDRVTCPEVLAQLSGMGRAGSLAQAEVELLMWLRTGLLKSLSFWCPSSCKVSSSQEQVMLWPHLGFSLPVLERQELSPVLVAVSSSLWIYPVVVSGNLGWLL